MRHLAAYMLCKLAGKAEPSSADVSKILKAADAEVDESAIKLVIDNIKNSGKSYEELLEEGKKKLASLPAAGAGASSAAAGAAEEKKEEKKEKTEEEEIIGGFGFADDD